MKKKHSSLYRYIGERHAEKPFGRLLDAGSGVNSINWVTSLETSAWTAVTGSNPEADQIRAAAGKSIRPQDKIILGNWASGELLRGEQFDTVLADYLLGAVEGFAPYFQPYLFERLRPLTESHLYVTGLEPYAVGDRPLDPAGQIVWEIGRYRDACIQLKGGMPYREYPSDWVIDRINRSGFKVTHIKHFNIAYKDYFVNAQIDVAIHRLDEVGDNTLAKALITRGEALREAGLNWVAKEGALRYCRNYVISAEVLA